MTQEELRLHNAVISVLSGGGITGNTVACLLPVSAQLIKRQTRGCPVLHLQSVL